MFDLFPFTLFVRLDAPVLAWFQRWADRLSDWFGLGCFQLARWFAVAYILCSFALDCTNGIRLGSFPYFGAFCSFWSFIWFRWFVSDVESATRPGFGNPAAQKIAWLRGMMVIMDITFLLSTTLRMTGIIPHNLDGLVEGWTATMESYYMAGLQVEAVLLACAAYFASCTSKPPRSIFAVEAV